MADRKLYKIIFLNNGKVYELFSEGVSTSGLWGFIEVSGLVFEAAKKPADSSREFFRSGLESFLKPYKA